MVSTPEIPSWLSRIYPFTPRSFSTPAGAKLSFLDEGPRSTHAVLMVHGNPTWSFYYRELARIVSPAHRCVVPDHIGMGLSEKPENYDYSLARRIADLEALITSLELRRIDLVVHDWGGAIGFGLAVRRPELIRRIVVLNTAAFTSKRLPFRIAVCKAPGLGPLLVRGANGFAWPATWMAMHHRKLTRDEKRGYLFPYDSWQHRVAVSAFVRDIPMRPSHPSWHTLRAVEGGLGQFRDREILITWGGRDFCFNDAFLERWREIFPHAMVTRYADAGHYVLDDAHEETAPLIAQFLSRPER